MLNHGINIDAHVSLAGVDRTPRGAGGTRALLDWVAGTGARGVRLDATRPDVRPRNLDRSARRDLAASVRRSGLAFGGLDLFIPPEHFTDAARAERATDAAIGSLRLAAEISGLTGDAEARSVAIVLPADLPGGALSDLETAAADVGATLADCAHPIRDDAALSHVLAGIDPPGVILGGESPAKLAARLGTRLAHARLADISGAGRCPIGAPGGKLDLTAYAAAVSVAGARSVTVDLRGLADADDAVRTALDAWAQALTIPGV